MKTVKQVVKDVRQHWVGDGFPVRSLFSYGGENEFDPFLLLDYAGPHNFASDEAKRGIGDASAPRIRDRDNSVSG